MYGVRCRGGRGVGSLEMSGLCAGAPRSSAGISSGGGDWMGGRTIWAAAIARNSAKHVRDGGDGRARAGERAEDEREEEQREGGDGRERTPRARSDASRAAANLSSPSHPPPPPSTASSSRRVLAFCSAVLRPSRIHHI